MRIDDYIDAAIRSTKITLAQQAVLWRIGRYAWKNGEAWMSFDTLADDCHVHRDQIRRHVAALVAAGIVTTTRRPGHTSVIRFPAHPAGNHADRAREIPRGSPRDSPLEPRVKTPSTPRDLYSRSPKEVVKEVAHAVCDLCDDGGYVTLVDASGKRWAQRCASCNPWPVEATR